MSMTDDEIGLSAEEQAQFDAMRGDAPGSNASSPDQLVDPPAGDATPPADGATPPADGVVQPPEDDEGVETIKDAAGKDVVDATGKPQKRVSFHKFQRLQQAYKELEGTAQRTAEERARIDERLKIINEALTTPPPVDPAAAAADADPEPDPEVNIFEWAKWSKRETIRLNDSFNEFRNAVTTERQEEAMASTYRQAANQFARTEPNFGGAYHFLISHRMGQLRAAGWNDETKIAQQVVKEERGLVKAALEEEVNPAVRLFEMAKAAGFVPAAPKAAAPAAETKVPGALDGPAAKAAAPASGKIPSVAEQVALAAQGAAAAVSLSTAGGAPMEQLTQAKLLAMPEEEFDAVVASLPKAKLRELFGD